MPGSVLMAPKCEHLCLICGPLSQFVRKWVEQHARTGNVEDGPRSGRPLKGEPPSTPTGTMEDAEAARKRPVKRVRAMDPTLKTVFRMETTWDSSAERW